METENTDELRAFPSDAGELATITGRQRLETMPGKAKTSEVSSNIVDDIVSEVGQNTDLNDAFLNLDRVAEEAKEDEFPIPSQLASVNARRLLSEIYQVLHQPILVYPTPDGEVALDVPGDSGHSVLLLCDSSGGALCLVNMNGKHRRAYYSDAGFLLDGFVREALNELARRRNRIA